MKKKLNIFNFFYGITIIILIIYYFNNNFFIEEFVPRGIKLPCGKEINYQILDVLDIECIT